MQLMLMAILIIQALCRAGTCRVCFLPILKEALVEFKHQWNTHRIRQNKVARCPHGVPDDLYHLPQLKVVDTFKLYICWFVLISGVKVYKQPLDLSVWAHCYLEYAYKPTPFYPDEFYSAACAVLVQLNMNCSDITVSNSKSVYLYFM